MDGKKLARLWHEVCEDLGPDHSLPTVVLPWNELSEEQVELKIKVAAEVLRRWGSRDTEEIKLT
jgi:hypothetical protein